MSKALWREARTQPGLSRHKRKVEGAGERGTGWTRAETVQGPLSWLRNPLPTPGAKETQTCLETSWHALELASYRRHSRQLDFHPVNHKSFLENLKSQFRSIEIIALHVKGKRAPFSYMDLL